MNPFLLGQEEQSTPPEELVGLFKHYAMNPVHYAEHALGCTPDPWQCDVLDCLADPEVDRIALRSCHGPGKTTLEALAVTWFTATRPESKVPTTAPTFHRQVRDLLWAEIGRWWRTFRLRLPWWADMFDLTTTRLQSKEFPNWYAVGIASKEAVNIEGYHAPHILIVFDEAKGIKRPSWDAARGMRTTGGGKTIVAEAKHLVASTPGGKQGEFYRVFTHYRSTWKTTFVIHPRALQGDPTLGKEAIGLDPSTGKATPGRYARGGTYYSDRVTKEWVEDFRIELGEDNPVYVAKVKGEFPELEGDVLIPVSWLERAQTRQQGTPGQRVISCDVARFGRDRTVYLAGEGGTLLHGETAAKYPSETTTQEFQDVGVGPDPKHPLYRSVVATAMTCRRLFEAWSASLIAVDETGVGGGVVDLLRYWGLPAIGVNFGASPTDKVKDEDIRESRARRGLRDTVFANLKAQMGLAIQRAFGTDSIALGRLPRNIVEPLIAQASQMGIEVNTLGQLRLIDPDDREEQEAFQGSSDMEGQRSPDHFHSLLIYWWMAGKHYKNIVPVGQAPQIPKHIAMIGESTKGGGHLGWTGHRPGMAPAAGQVAGPAAWVRRRY